MRNDLVDFRAAAELSDAEFLLHGTTPWLRALDEAEAIGREVFGGGGDGRGVSEDRIGRLENELAALNWRDDLDTAVELRPLAGVVLVVALNEAPHMLRRLAAAS